jgi:hypothetical protein
MEINFNPGIPTSICEVEVVYEHAIDVAEQYAEKGIMYTTNNNMNPVVLNVVGKNFTGLNLESNEDIRDDIINIRTTFCNTTGHTSGSQFPVKEKQCVYSKAVSVIRPKNPVDFIPFPQIYRFALITTSAIKAEKILSENRMNSDDYCNTCTTIECVFQTAIARGHPVLVLTPFGHVEENNPVSDIIKIYNYCILKYGHWFKKIIVAVPQHYPKSSFESYHDSIMKPQEIVTEIEDECEVDEMRQTLLAKSAAQNASLQNPMETPMMNNPMMNNPMMNNPMMNNPMMNQQNNMNMTPEQIQMAMAMFANMNMNNQN